MDQQHSKFICEKCFAEFYSANDFQVHHKRKCFINAASKDQGYLNEKNSVNRF